MDSNKIKKSAVAGTFYPGSAIEIRRILDALKQKTGNRKWNQSPPIIIVPHAGWQYSGLAAVKGISTLADSPPKRIVLIGPSHYHYFLGFSLGAYEKYLTPLGELKGDLTLWDEIADFTGYGFVPEAYSREHSLEVIMPMIQHLVPGTYKILPILAGNVSHSEIARLADALAATLDPLKDTVIISTDLSHFYRYEDARELDSDTLDLIIEGNEQALIERAGADGRLCCGATGVVVAINLAKKWKLARPEILIYYNSGDSGGDLERVVGYASLAFPPPDISGLDLQESESYAQPDSKKDEPGQAELPSLSDENKKFLRIVAREAIENYVKGKPPARLLYDDPKLKGKWGAFVTLKVKGNLRGCIGNISSDRPLPETIAELAIKSASYDPRFPPVGPAELDDLELEISILSNIYEVSDISEIEIGRDGLIIEQHGRRGLLLPQVATEHHLDVPSFLSQTCVKAGLHPDSWKHGARIYRFSALIF